MNAWDEHSFDWDLPGDAVIVEVGGYEGRWLAGMYERYPGAYHVFEPQPWALSRLRERIAAIAQPGRVVIYHPCGLGIERAEVSLGGFHTDAASILKTPEWYERNGWEGRNERGTITLEPVGPSLNMPRIDVLCMNIEGYEFVLLPEMVRLGIVPRIRNLMVQFHHGYDVPVDEVAVRLMLGETHDVLWDYPALTAWRLRE